ncbi:alpha/beta hydrolase [Amaricoccus sp.]|uniref:alpha/beta fold hydrolase n=1 Tax=Amaricoccus sp. TaxID=1872485 RepID=UPI001B4E4468|nr:alpha/beta hydrolase [Amaricoccus sp.]MBP7243349.1 alpha/beta hydrolase [Amaricoccus sp.]
MSGEAPFFAEVADAPEGVRAFWMEAQDGTRLRAAVWSGGAAGTAIVLPGRTEFVEKYGRVVTRLRERDLSVAVIDWRGQGLSQRHPVTPHLGHVDDFRRYQEDVRALLSHPEVAALPGPRHMIAHSMGACIGLRTLLEESGFATAVFTAPMWHLQMRAATRELTAKMTRLASAFGFGLRLTPGASPRPTALSVEFETNALTSDPEHFAWCVRQITAHPELSLGGPNVQWTRAALEEMARLYVAPLPNLPVLTFLGSEERVVSASVIRSQMKAMRAGRLVDLEGARHEIFMERPEILAVVWNEIDGFLAAPLSGRQAVG